MTQLIHVPVPVDDRLRQLARRHRDAGGIGLHVLNMVGSRAETLLDRLPPGVKGQMEAATVHALTAAMRTAGMSRQVVPDQKGWMNTAVTTAMGAVGGAGGLPTALAELPATITVLLRAIQGIAQEHGFDTDQAEVQKECLTVFSSAGPMEADDGADAAFLSARVTLTGATVHGLIRRVAPQLSAVLGQKLAAQTVPILGAAAGAATNYAYTRYYQEMAHVHFGLIRLSLETGIERKVLLEKMLKFQKNA